MKVSKALTAALAIFSLSVIVACSNTRMVSPNTAYNAVMLLKHSFDQGDYERFQTYFTDAQRNKISKEQFRELSELATAGWGHDTYSVITFENGEKLLINTVKDLEDGYYKIQDIKRVPEEWKELFIR